MELMLYREPERALEWIVLSSSADSMPLLGRLNICVRGRTGGISKMSLNPLEEK
jgi:hypothetical protein